MRNVMYLNLNNNVTWLYLFIAELKPRAVNRGSHWKRNRKSAIKHFNNSHGTRLPESLTVLTDLAGTAGLAADGEDYLIPSSILNSIVSGLISRSVLNNNYLNEGVGTAYGIEFLLNKAISDKWYGWLSIAYSKTERENLATGEDFTYAYDIPWIINAVTTYEFNEYWQLGGIGYFPMEPMTIGFELGVNYMVYGMTH